VAGVVNVILKKNYNATELSAYYGNTTEEDMGTQTYSFVTGYADGENSFLVGGSFYQQNALYSKDRDRSSGAGTSAVSNPGWILDLDRVYDGPPGTTGTSVDDYREFNGLTDTFPYPLFTPAVRPSERFSIFGNGEKALFGENLKFFADTMYSHTLSYNQLAPTPIISYYTTTPTSPNGLGIPSTNPYNVFGQDIADWLYRTAELGPRTEDIETDMFRIVTGSRGRFRTPRCIGKPRSFMAKIRAQRSWEANLVPARWNWLLTIPIRRRHSIRLAIEPIRRRSWPG
jgi:iron complex outermembrane recepter protein